MVRIRTPLVIVCIFAVLGCTAVQLQLPPVTDEPTGAHIPGKIIWHDLLTDDADAARRFYSELFGWEFEALSPSLTLGQSSAYSVIRLNGVPIAGMVDTTKLPTKADITQWVSIMSVADVDAAAAGFGKSGGTVYTSATDLPDRGRISIVADAQGALVALLKSEGGDPRDAEPPINGFLWDELWTDDPDQSIAFFSELIGYEEDAVAVDDLEYRFLSAGGEPRVGIRKNPLPGLTPTWVTFIRVEDPAAVAGRVADLGGRVVVEPHANPIGGQVAVIADPSGAGLVIQSWTPQERS